jgi:hypothetical protein
VLARAAARKEKRRQIFQGPKQLPLTNAERQRRYFERDPERSRERGRRYYWRNRDEQVADSKQWRIDNPLKAMVNDMFCDARERARAKGLPFTIKRADIVVPVTCPYLGITLQRGTFGGHKASPSLDRIRPHLGYVPGNVEVISKLANWIKNCGTAEEILKVGERMLRTEGKLQ